MEQNNQIIEQLRKSLLDHIKSNERVLSKFNKILNWLFIIFSCVCVSLLVAVIFFIYSVRKSDRTVELAIKQIGEVAKTAQLQHKLNDSDRKDIARARADIAPIIRIKDSILKHRDSIIDLEYRKATNKK